MKSRCCIAIYSVMLGLLNATPALTADPPPKLILQITVDQLRGDLLTRYLDRMGDGGLRYLLDEGVVYLDAHHAHANTETIVGHATLATGAHPSVHGMVGNVWFDRVEGRLVYNVEDEDFPILSADAGVDDDQEIDPTQKVAGTDGRSPLAILSSTFSDELALAFGSKAKIFGISVKDRGAISMAGHAGKAFWFSKKSGEFITSSYYHDSYPEWVVAWNAEALPLAYADQAWELLEAHESYVNAERDDLAYEVDLPGFGRVFPHAFGPAEGKLFTTLLTVSPAGDELTMAFAKRLIEAEDLGRDAVPDYLSVSLSSTDYIGHIFGPSSLETEDQMLRLDRALADLLAFVDDRVGLAETLIVLSADHGAADPPGYLNEFGIPAHYIYPKSWNTAPGLARLQSRFGLGEELISEYFHPYVYLNREAIAKAGLDLREVEVAVADEMMKLPGITLAISSSALASGDHPDTAIISSILNNHHPARSGDVFVVFEPHSFINDFDGLTVASHHGSPWRYDTFVPLILAGNGLSPRRVARQVETVDLAPTLSAYLGIKAPSGATGHLLEEVLVDNHGGREAGK
ncbi:MAG: alkaline phosphatase family protein [Geminicoccaceae bacterium]